MQKLISHFKTFLRSTFLASFLICTFAFVSTAIAEDAPAGDGGKEAAAGADNSAAAQETKKEVAKDQDIEKVAKGETEGGKETAKEAGEAITKEGAGAGSVDGVRETTAESIRQIDKKIAETERIVLEKCANPRSAECHQANASAKAAIRTYRKEKRQLQQSDASLERTRDQMTDRTQVKAPPVERSRASVDQGDASKQAERAVDRQVQQGQPAGDQVNKDGQVAQDRGQNPGGIADQPGQRDGQNGDGARDQNDGRVSDGQVKETKEVAERVKAETERQANQAIRTARPPVPVERTDETRQKIVDNTPKIDEIRQQVRSDTREAENPRSREALINNKLKESGIDPKTATGEQRGKAAYEVRQDRHKYIENETAKRFGEATGLSQTDSKRYIENHKEAMASIERSEIDKKMRDFDRANPSATGEERVVAYRKAMNDVEGTMDVAKSREVQQSLASGGDPSQTIKSSLGHRSTVQNAGFEAMKEQAGQLQPPLPPDAFKSKERLQVALAAHKDKQAVRGVYRKTRQAEQDMASLLREKDPNGTPSNSTLTTDGRYQYKYSKEGPGQRHQDRYEKPTHPGSVACRGKECHGPGYERVNSRTGAIIDRNGRTIGNIRDGSPLAERIKRRLTGNNPAERGRTDRSGRTNPGGFEVPGPGTQVGGQPRGNTPANGRDDDFRGRFVDSSTENGQAVDRALSDSLAKIDQLIKEREALKARPQSTIGAVMTNVSTSVLKGSRKILSFFQSEDKQAPEVVGDDRFKVVAKETSKSATRTVAAAKKEEKKKEKQKEKADLSWMDEEEDGVKDTNRQISNVAKKKGIKVDHLRPTREQLIRKYRGQVEGYEEQLTFTGMNGRSNWEKVQLRYEAVRVVMKK